MRLIIGSDKSGFQLKEAIKTHLIGKDHEVQDLGLTDPAGMKPYYEVASAVARRISQDETAKAILVCGTGAGMCIVANKFPGVHAVAVEGIYTARMSAIVNQANVITLGGWVVAPQMAIEMVEIWLSATFAEGFPPDRQRFLCNAFTEVQKIEKANLSLSGQS